MAWLEKLSAAWDSIETAKQKQGDVEAAKQASRDVFTAAADKAAALRKKTQETADKAAEAFARTATEWTGREMTAADVKRSARIGAAVGAVVAVGPVVGMALRQARANGAVAAAGQPGVSGDQDSGTTINPDVPPADPTEAWEQDDIAYDQMQYDNLQDHIQHQDQLNDVIDDQISYTEGMDMGFECDF